MDINTLGTNNFFKYNALLVSGKSSVSGATGTTKGFSFEMSRVDFSFQSYVGALSNNVQFSQNLSDFIDYKAIGYAGKPIEALSQNEAKELVSENGFFGVQQTAQRIPGFVINGAGDNLEKLQEGRKGVLQGFEAAEATWGQKLFDISYDTLAKALETIDARIAELGGSVLDTQA